jgi:HEAT repeat protein
MATKPGPKAFSQILADLANEKYPPARHNLLALSDLSGKQLEQFKQAWPAIADARRLAILTRLGEIAEESFELDIRAVSRAALDDGDGGVRAAAIRNLWEDEGEDLIEVFIHVLQHDESVEARAAAATALGQYVFLGEMEELDEGKARRVEETLLNVWAGDDELDVRRRALESIGFASRPEAASAIEDAYDSDEEQLKLSALFAMGRSLDSGRWGDTVIGDLAHDNPKVRFEAARAAGELQLREAVPALSEVLHDVDGEVQEMSVWALGEIGGDEAREALRERLEDDISDDLSELIEDALANAEFMDELSEMGLMEFDDGEAIDDGDEDDDDEIARKSRLN